ncbi:MAG: polyprenyl synthetase family protein, partial [Oscillospiraceae bacterium]|nr:polyprenyl synthetase family protein [Oscillospiraceae bacterium]
MDEKLFSARISEYRERVDGYLTGCLSPASRARYHKLIDSMRYSLTAGGKRLRPILTLEFCRVCGGDVQAALPVACGVEMLHTYSLIHDDLPVMDNDDLRRGKPSNHKVFGECTALLAGDALQALAFQTVLSAPLPPERTLRCAQILAYAAGHEGICGGQQLDLAWEGLALTADELHEIYLRKTSALIRAACLMGAAAAGGTVAQEKAAADYADHFGYAFQLRDDMLDVIGDEKTFGKPI